MKREDPRPKEYMYWNQLMNHLDGDQNKIFNGEFIWPRQFEIHLPANHIVPCNLHCPHCAGKFFDRAVDDRWEMKGLELLDKLQGAIPYHIYGGAYTEPLMNPYYMTYLHMTKKHGSHFGIHTNATLLNMLQKEQGWLTELNAIATDETDYLSVAIDAGTPWSWSKTKGTIKNEVFYEVIEGVRKACLIRKKHGKTHAIRLCYLISPESGNINDFLSIISLAKSMGVDSLRFSIPFGNYNQDFDEIRKYKKEIEEPGDIKYYNMLKPYLSASQDERPYIFYTGPEFTDIDKFDDITKCAYGYYQITYGADGYAYRCSTVATPTGKQCRLGKITADLEEFKKIIMRNYDPTFNCAEQCFAKGLRCNRMGLEINRLAAGLEL